MLIQHFDVVARVLLCRKRVHLAADGVDGLCDVLGTARGSSLEQHVLDEMGDAAVLLRLMTGAASEPHADTYRTHMRHPLGDESEPAGKQVANDRCFRH